ncbi:MAG: cAMP-binding protein [Acidobacteria bacterium]|nr:cAMP-binding protein [Acidobacteriota bacterium]
MEATIPEANIKEALESVGQYLSDTIPPIQAAESVGVLLAQPAHLIVSSILEWIPAQFRGNSRGASYADYLFHAVSKLYYLAQLQLISEQALTPYLDSVKQLLLARCPKEDLRLLQQNFDRLGMAETATATPINLIYRQMKPGESESRIAEGSSSAQSRERRFSVLRDRLEAAVRQSADGSVEEEDKNLIPNMIATAASDAKSSEEFRRLQENLKSLGIASGTDHIYKTLSQSLPGWMIGSSGTDTVKSRNPAVEAMSQIIHLAEDRWEGCKRFQDLVRAATEQFNTGSYARAATMFDLALAISSDEKVDPSAVTSIRKTAHESLDYNRLRTLAKDTDRQPLLRKILNFFDEFTAENMLDSLEKEEKRDRRRLLLDLLEMHGTAARVMAFDRLKELLSRTNIATDWHFARNLICILNRIPRSAEVTAKTETDLLAPLLRLSLPAPLVKEAITFAGRVQCPESEELLISTADKLEGVVAEYAKSGRDVTKKLSLLDRTIFALAHYGTPKAYGRVVKHGTGRREGMGDAASRLAYLSSEDLSADKESLAILIQFLKSKTPRRLLGLTIQKNEQPLIHAIKALSSTPAPIVRQTLEHMSERFPETRFGQAAAAVLKEFEVLDTTEIRADRMLTGDLELFGLPDLFHQLNMMQATGTLRLSDAKGNPAGTLSLLSGRMQDCSAGHLTGNEAAYQLLEKPITGTFVFQGQRNPGIPEPSDEEKTADLNAILAEGIRRYDEVQRTRALVPDYCMLRRRGIQFIRPAEHMDAALAELLWQKTAAGTSPEECEAVYPADSYRIRGILAHWVEEGILIVE